MNKEKSITVNTVSETVEVKNEHKQGDEETNNKK